MPSYKIIFKTNNRKDEVKTTNDIYIVNIGKEINKLSSVWDHAFRSFSCCHNTRRDTKFVFFLKIVSLLIYVNSKYTVINVFLSNNNLGVCFLLDILEIYLLHSIYKRKRPIPYKFINLLHQHLEVTIVRSGQPNLFFVYIRGSQTESIEKFSESTHKKYK